MAATVVSVVIFLCGVLVGRGVRAERATVAEAPTVADPAPAPAAQIAAVQPSAGSDPTAAPPPANDELSYFNRLEKATAPAEQLKPAAAGRAATAPQTSTGKSAPAPEKPA